MINLIRKDILNQKKTVIFAGAYSLLFLIIFTISSIEQTSFISIVKTASPIMTMYMLLLGTFKDEKNHFDGYIAALPVSRKEIVFSKFAGAGLFLLYGMAMTSLVLWLYGLLPMALPFQFYSAGEFIGLISGMAVLMILLPFFFKYGYDVIRYITMGIFLFFMLAGTLIQTIIKSVSGNSLLARLIKLVTELPDAFVIGGILALIALVVAVSLVSSLQVMKRKNY